MSFRLHLVNVLPDDTKVTDMLYSCYGQAILGEDAEKDFEEQLEAIKERYNSIIRGLGSETESG